MRPPEFTGGNCPELVDRGHVSGSFNEAAGIHRRKPTNGGAVATDYIGFNEAAGIHRRKLGVALDAPPEIRDASMRPPEFTGGNPVSMLAFNSLSLVSLQ